MKRLWLAHEGFIGPWICKKVGAHWNPGGMQAAGVGHEENGAHDPDGAALWENYSGEGGSVVLHMAGVRPHWGTRDFFWAVAHYSFNIMKVNKVITSTRSSNTKALRFNERVGFVHEYTIEGAYPGGDAAVIRTMTRDQCRWLVDKFKPSWAEAA